MNRQANQGPNPWLACRSCCIGTQMVQMNREICIKRIQIEGESVKCDRKTPAHWRRRFVCGKENLVNRLSGFFLFYPSDDGADSDVCAGLTLQTAGCDAFYQILLEEDEDQHHG